MYPIPFVQNSYTDKYILLTKLYVQVQYIVQCSLIPIVKSITMYNRNLCKKVTGKTVSGKKPGNKKFGKKVPIF